VDIGLESNKDYIKDKHAWIWRLNEILNKIMAAFIENKLISSVELQYG
jgi:hypothetical protein